MCANQVKKGKLGSPDHEACGLSYVKYNIVLVPITDEDLPRKRFPYNTVMHTAEDYT